MPYQEMEQGVVCPVNFVGNKLWMVAYDNSRLICEMMDMEYYATLQ